MSKLVEFYAASTESEDEVLLEITFDDGRQIDLFVDLPDTFSETIGDKVYERRPRDATHLAAVLMGRPATQPTEGA